MSRLLLLALLALSPFNLRLQAAAPPGPLPSQIQQWIGQLGDDDFRTREKATRALRAAGERAEAALEAVANSEDAEVKRRVLSILNKFRVGIYPDTPDAVVDLIGKYGTVSGSEKGPIVQSLIEAGAPGIRALVKLVRAEKDPLVRKDVFAAIGPSVVRNAPVLIDAGRYDTVEQLLELATEGDVQAGATHLAAFHLLRGTLKSKIAEYQARAKKNPPGKAQHEVLIFLHRAAGDYPAAIESAKLAEVPLLIEGLLYEQGDWKALLAREDLSAHSRPEVNKGYRAAFARLAGDAKLRDQLLDELIEKARPLAKEKQDILLFAKALFFNGRTNEALELMATAGNQPRLLFEGYIAQMRYKEAFDLADTWEKNNRPEAALLRVLEARARHSLGQKEQARKLLDAAASRMKEGKPLPYFAELLEVEIALVRREEAVKWFADYLAATKDETHTPAFWKALFKEIGDDALILWYSIRGEDFGGTTPEKIALLRRLCEGKAKPDEVSDFVKKVRERPVDGSVTEARMRALGEICVLNKQEKLAIDCFTEAGPRGAIRWGDLLRVAKKYPRALEAYLAAYEQSAKREKVLELDEREGEALPSMALLLAAEVHQLLGDKGKAEELIEKAHLLLLADVRKRLAFARALRERELRDAERREGSLLARLGDPIIENADSYYTMEGVRILALAAERKGDSASAALGLEKVFLGCLQPGINFTRGPAYVTVPSHVFKLHAVGHAKAGRWDQANEAATLAVRGWPANLDVVIGLVPLLDKAGKKAEADKLYRTAQAKHETVLKEFPDSPLMFNQAAWLAACCRRDAENAVKWAKRATELAPKTSAYLDTLAEALFQAGQKDEALAAIKRAIELEPKRRYYKEQQKRIEAGDPKAALPPEE
jgi:tetratricopeptide (TPR) repeat protein